MFKNKYRICLISLKVRKDKSGNLLAATFTKNGDTTSVKFNKKIIPSRITVSFSFKKGNNNLDLSMTASRCKEMGCTGNAEVWVKGKGINRKITINTNSPHNKRLPKNYALLTHRDGTTIRKGQLNLKTSKITGLGSKFRISDALKPEHLELVRPFGKLLKQQRDHSRLLMRNNSVKTTHSRYNNPVQVLTIDGPEEACELACDIAFAMATTVCCAGTAGWGCFVCMALGIAGAKLCRENCHNKIHPSSVVV